MDLLLEIAPALEREVFHQVATLLNLEVDLLFFDTTSTYFSRDETDDPVYRDGRGHPLSESGGIGPDEDQDQLDAGPRAQLRPLSQGYVERKNPPAPSPSPGSCSSKQ